MRGFEPSNSAQDVVIQTKIVPHRENFSPQARNCRKKPHQTEIAPCHDFQKKVDFVYDPKEIRLLWFPRELDVLNNLL